MAISRRPGGYREASLRGGGHARWDTVAGAEEAKACAFLAGRLAAGWPFRGGLRAVPRGTVGHSVGAVTYTARDADKMESSDPS